jgi:hypothetical protein
VLPNFTVEAKGIALLATFRNVLSDEEFDGFLNKITEHLDSGVRRVLIADHTQLRALPPSQRHALVEYRKKNASRYQAAFPGIVYVQPSALLRGALQATFWFIKPPVPTKVVETMGQAWQWAEELAKETGLEP